MDFRLPTFEEVKKDPIIMYNHILIAELGLKEMGIFESIENIERFSNAWELMIQNNDLPLIEQYDWFLLYAQYLNEYIEIHKDDF